MKRSGRRLSSHVGRGSKSEDLVGHLARIDLISTGVTGRKEDRQGDERG